MRDPLSPAGGRSVIHELHLVPPDGTVVLAGEVDLHNVDQLHAALEASLAALVERVLVDLTRVLFLSLAALGALVDAARALEARGGRLATRGLRPLHRQVLELLAAPTGMVVGEAVDG